MRRRSAWVLPAVGLAAAAVVATAALTDRSGSTVAAGLIVAPPASAALPTTTPTTEPGSTVAPRAGVGPVASPTTVDASPAPDPLPAATDPGWRGSGEAVTFVFAGDTNFTKGLADGVRRDPEGLLAPTRALTAGADVAVLNLETAITERGEPLDKAFTFRAPPSALTAIRNAGFDAASVANNHGKDYGDVGLEDTISAGEQAGFPLIGIGRDAAQAYAPWRTTVRGQRIAVFAATDVLDAQYVADWTAGPGKPGLASAKDDRTLPDAVRAERPRADTIVVFLHWGRERMTCPTGRQTQLARLLVDAGADIVVGAHTHRLLGGGMNGDAFVHYGLGNFVWANEDETGVIRVTATGRVIEGYEWIPATVRGGVPRPMAAERSGAAIAAWNALRRCTDLRP